MDGFINKAKQFAESDQGKNLINEYVGGNKQGQQGGQSGNQDVSDARQWCEAVMQDDVVEGGRDPCVAGSGGLRAAAPAAASMLTPCTAELRLGQPELWLRQLRLGQPELGLG
jgi:hypothetical protein